jgi:hypothetical protein
MLPTGGVRRRAGGGVAPGEAAGDVDPNPDGTGQLLTITLASSGGFARHMIMTKFIGPSPAGRVEAARDDLPTSKGIAFSPVRAELSEQRLRLNYLVAAEAIKAHLPAGLTQEKRRCGCCQRAPFSLTRRRACINRSR